MAKKPGVTTIATGYYSRAALNANFEALNTAFDNTISRDGSTPNTMDSTLDLNDNEIINAVGKFNKLYLNNTLVSNLSTAFTFRNAWSVSTSYNLYDVVAESGNSYISLVSHTSGSNFSSDLAAGKWFILAAKGASGTGTGDMLGSNNLSDLASSSAALGNLGISSTAAELNYTDGVSSNIQTQLNARNAQAASAWTTGTSTTEGIISPLKVASAIDALAFPSYDLDSDGYLVLGMGLEVVWGTFSSTTDTNQTVDFHRAFTNECWGVAMGGFTSAMTGSLSGNHVFAAKVLSKTQFLVDRNNDISGIQDYNYIAWGK